MKKVPSERTYYSYASSPIGPLQLVSDGHALTALNMLDPGDAESVAVGEGWIRDDDASPFPQARVQLAAYFKGDLTQFDLPLALRGTEFQRNVWRQLATIPYGVTISYLELATRIGNPAALRAVGLANGRNPIPIIIPCHRVIGANGKLVGYGGGLPRKAALLDFEFSVRISGPQPFPTGT